MPTTGHATSTPSLADRATRCDSSPPEAIPRTSIFLGKRLTTLRETTPLRQRDFIDRPGMCSYDAWEIDKRRTPFRALPSIGELLRVDVHALLHGVRFAERAYVAWHTRTHDGVFDEALFADWCLDQPEPEPEPEPPAEPPTPVVRRRPAFRVPPPPERPRPVLPIVGPVSIDGRNVARLAEHRWVLRCRSCRAEHRIPLGRHGPRECTGCGRPLAARVSVRVSR